MLSLEILRLRRNRYVDLFRESWFGYIKRRKPLEEVPVSENPLVAYGKKQGNIFYVSRVIRKKGDCILMKDNVSCICNITPLYYADYMFHNDDEKTSLWLEDADCFHVVRADRADEGFKKLIADVSEPYLRFINSKN